MTAMHFDGATFDYQRDGARLGFQASVVWTLMLDGQWRTLWQIAQMTGAPEASISARLRDLRKPKFGGHEVERRYVGAGEWEYRVVPNPDAAMLTYNLDQP